MYTRGVECRHPLAALQRGVEGAFIFVCGTCFVDGLQLERDPFVSVDVPGAEDGACRRVVSPIV